MRILFATLFFVVLFFISCKKEDPSSIDKQLVGQWRWTIQYRGSPINTLTPQNTGIQETIYFNKNGSWSLIKNNLIVRSGKFKTSIKINNLGKKGKCVALLPGHFGARLYCVF